MNKKIIFIAYILTLVNLISLVNAQWIEDPLNPIFDPALRAYYPSVIYDINQFSGHGSANYYKMWYGTTGGQTALAVSDDGINWVDLGVVIPNGYHAHVIYDETGFGSGIYYKMWYWDPSELYSINAIRYAESSDGINWINDQAVTQVGSSVIDNSVSSNWNRGTYGVMDVFYNPSGSVTYDDSDIFNNKYVMYYDGTTGGQESTGVAYSVDAIEWKGFGEVLPVAGSGWDSDYATFGTTVEMCPGDWELYYSGGTTASNHGIGIATSNDRLNWVRDPLNPIMHITDGVPYRDERTYTPSVICDNAGFSGHGSYDYCKMWFTCRAGGNYAICLAIHNSDCDGDGFDFDVDCDDTNASINPAALEILYNCIDDDCNASTLDGGTTVTVATPNGNVDLSTDIGNFCCIPPTNVNPNTLPQAGIPNLQFPYNLFEFQICNTGIGGTATITLTLPNPITDLAEYWKYGPNGDPILPNPQPARWYEIPLFDNDGDNILQIQLTDGGTGDDDGIADTIIIDQGGPGIPGGLSAPIMPYILFLILIIMTLGVGFISIKK